MVWLGGLLPILGFPKSLEVPACWIFLQEEDDKPQKQSKSLRVQASECLAIYPIVRQFVYHVALPNGLQAPACQALLAMASLIGQVHDGNLAGIISKGTLLPAIELAIQCFQTAFPEVSLIKKWHWLLHMPDTQQRFGFPPSCFANDRKRKPTGQLATSLLNKKNLKPISWSKLLPRRSATWTSHSCSKMVCVWSTPSQLPRKVYKLYPI